MIGLHQQKRHVDPNCKANSSHTSTVLRQIACSGVAVASLAPVSENRLSSDRRTVGDDRRKNSRGGRRSTDPHTNWRRLAWLFAAYAAYLSVRSLPATMKEYFTRRQTPAN